MLGIQLVAILEGGSRRVITSVEGAARCLVRAWAADRALESYKIACFTCLAAMEGETTAAQAREAIIEAAKDAGILA